MQKLEINKDVRGDEKSPTREMASYSLIVERHAASLANGFVEVERWKRQQAQLRRDLQLEAFHRSLIEALHYSELFKRARWE